MPAAEVTEKLPGLTLLRFLAAFYVFVFHFQSRFKLSLPTALVSVVDNGPIAMPIFFMLSGFVLHLRYATKYESFRQFYIARIARIYPAYLLCVLMCLPLVILTSSRTDIWFLISALAFLVISILLIQAWYPNIFPFSHVSGTWSVSVEMFLYATYPLTRCIARLTRSQCIFVILGCTLVGGSVVPSTLLSFSRDLSFSVFYVIPIYHVPEFVMGVTIAAIYLTGAGRSSTWAVAGLILLLVLALFGEYNARYMGLNVVLLPLIAALIFGMASADRSRIQVVRAIVTNRLSIYLGEISYSFFLMQIPMMLFVDSHPSITRMITGPTTFLVLLFVNLIVASLSFRFVERPGQRFLLRMLRSSPMQRGEERQVMSAVQSGKLDSLP
jgi:peptidoglycan/LPS O-acetylase OafA/YrhL